MDIDMDSSLVEEFLKKKAGPDAYTVAKALDSGLTDEEISDKTDLEVKKIRAILNRLHYLGIIEYDKEQAKESSWYTYTWFLRESRIKELLEETYKEELQKLEKELELRETHVFFQCDNECEKLPFEVAYEYGFKCPECGEKMQKSEENGVDKIKERISEIKSLLGEEEEDE